MVDIAGRVGHFGFVQPASTVVGPGVVAGTLAGVVTVEEHIGWKWVEVVG